MTLKTSAPRFLVRGRVVAILRDLHRAQFLEVDWSAFLETLPLDAAWRRPLANDEWLDPADVSACEAAAVARLGTPTLRLRGEVVADRIVDEVPGLVLNRGADGFLRSVTTYWNWIHQGHSLTVEELVPGRARLRLEGPIPYPEWATTVAPTLLRRPMERCGARHVDIQVQVLDAVGLRFELRWSEA